jgi:hypothetical protein
LALSLIVTLNLTYTPLLCKSCFFHIRALRHIRPALTLDAAKTVACSLVGSRLDYANSILYGASEKNISRLQRVHSTLARVVAGTGYYDSSSSILSSLHWLPVKQRINFKLATLTFKIRSAQGPLYLSQHVVDYVPPRCLRSSSRNYLTVPRTNTVIGTRGFRSAAPTVWNSLPDDIRLTDSLHVFKRKLKTHSYTAAFEH